MADTIFLTRNPHDRSEVWIGLAEVYPAPGCSILDSDKGACINIVASAENFQAFESRVKQLCEAYHLELWSLDDAEPFRVRRKTWTVDPEIEQLVTDVSNTDQIRFSTLHTFPVSEGKKPH